MLNLELFEQVKAAILAEPENFGMDDYYGSPDLVGVKQPQENKCGTAHCIAGFAALLGTGTRDLSQLPGGAEATARKLLGCKPDDLGHIGLFFVADWPADLSDEYQSARTNKLAAKIVVKAIDTYIENPKSFGVWLEEEN